MKNQLFLIIYSFTFLVQSCGNSNNGMPNGDCLSLLIDRTDALRAEKELSENDFLPLLQVTSSDPLASANVCLAPITNIRFERSYSVTIPETDSYSVNELDRKDQIEAFKAQVASCLQMIHKMPVGVQGSAIFEGISIELNDLAMCNNGTKKTMVVISDLLENTAWFNAYNQSALGEFVDNPKKFNKRLDKYCPIKHSIKGIILYLIHQPQSVVQDNQFYQLSGLLKDYLEAKGAIVHISASLK